MTRTPLGQDGIALNAQPTTLYRVTRPVGQY
jgi:hypothetical protein